MSTEPGNERERIRLQILAKHKAIDVFLAYGDAADADKCRNEIARLQSQLESEKAKGDNDHHGNRRATHHGR
jgi:hypothetical protein